MKKRFLAMLLSLVMAVGMLPMVSFTASAAPGDVVFFDDFESYNNGDVFYGSDGDVMMKDGVAMWAPGANLKSTVERMAGYDGTQTNVLKVENAVEGTKDSYFRFWVKDGATLPVTSGLYVMEVKVLVGSHMYYNFGPLKRQMSEYCLLNKNTPFTNTGSGWVSLRFVIDADTDKTLIYVNDSLVTNYGDKNVYEYTYTADAFPNYLTLQNAKNVGLYTYIDDVKFYYAPSAATKTATSPADEASEVSKGAKPSVTYSCEILDAVINGDATVSSDCVEIIKTEDSSTVEVSSVELSLDGKTVTATPATELEYGTEYSVTFKDLTDVYGRKVADVTYSFTTMEAPATSVTAPVFRKEALEETEGDVITALENGYISCEYSITNNSTTKTQNVLMIGVLWENDAIKSFLFVKKALGYNETADFYGGFNVTDAENSKIETYIWDGITTMVPLSQKGEFTTTGYSEQ